MQLCCYCSVFLPKRTTNQPTPTFFDMAMSLIDECACFIVQGQTRKKTWVRVGGLHYSQAIWDREGLLLKSFHFYDTKQHSTCNMRVLLCCNVKNEDMHDAAAVKHDNVPSW